MKAVKIQFETIMKRVAGFFLKKWANPGLFFVYFRSFLITISIQIEKSIDGVLGIRTHGRRMVGADETTELWRPPHCFSNNVCLKVFHYYEVPPFI